MPIFYIALSIAFGWSITQILPMTFRRLEAAAFSTAIGLNLSAFITLIITFICGFNFGLPIAILLQIICTVGLFLKFEKRAIVTSKLYCISRWRYLFWPLGLGSAFIVCLLTALSYQFPDSTGAWVTNGNAFGDAPLHMALANHLSLGDKLDLISPIYKKSELTYPFLADFYTAILRRLGASWKFAFIAPSLLMMLSLLQLVYSFGYRLLKSALGAWLQFLMIIYSGSLRGGIILSSVLITKGIKAYNEKVGDSIALSTGDQYLNFIHSHPLPQRSYLFGMPLLIVVISIALEIYRTFKPKISSHAVRTAAIIAGILAGIMPIIHVHSFLIVAGILGLSTVCLYIWKRRLPPGWLWMITTAAIIALPQLYWQFSHSFNGKFSHFIAGWMMQNFSPVTNINFLYFWLSQLGILFLTIGFGWFWLRRYNTKPEIWFTYIVGCLIFAICNIYAFQPTLWDNMKLFMYSFWFIMIVTAYIFAHWARNVIGAIFVGLCMASLTVYGFLTLAITAPKFNFSILSPDDAAFGAKAQKLLPENSYVLVSGRHSHPITMLTNHKVLILYGGWYNLYGADWVEVSDDRSKMLKGDSSTPRLIDKYGLTSVVFSDAEVSDGTANVDYFYNNYILITHEKGWWVFDLNKN